ncbi:transcription factor Gibbin [Festucalex cinctus]
MSGLSAHLHTGQTGRLAGPEPWTAGLLARHDPPPVTDDLALANGAHPQRRGGHRTCPPRRPATGAEPTGSMQTHVDTLSRSRAALDSCGSLEAQQSRTLSTASPKSSSLALANHPIAAGRSLAPETDLAANVCSSPLIVEAERKYALRSSGRSRFPCHVRKSSRLRRIPEDSERRLEKERADEEALLRCEEIWSVKEEQAEEEAVTNKEPPSTEAVVPAVSDVPLALTIPNPVPKAAPKPGPRLGHRPGPKSRSRPAPKSVQKPGPKSVMRRRQAAQAALQCGANHLPPPAVPLPLVKKEVQIFSPNGRRCGRFVGVRKIVVKVARIPVNLGRRQKSYKISNLETVTLSEKGGTAEGTEVVREPTALLRMKNNGKSVMVMFPPGELPLIVKRRRGRPPKQPVLLIPGEGPAHGGDGDPLKKPRRRRRTKLPCPYPSYVGDTNDVMTEYGDVLSKLAFLNRQPPATGRCSPPRCWTPSEPESFHTPSENPGISTLLHRLTGSRRPRGSRGGGSGRGGGAAGGSEHNKSTFCEFFEAIGKKRKPGPLSEHGLPRKRGKGVGRGGGVVGTEPGGEKTVRKRRVRKNGALKGEGQEWPNGSGGWGEEDSDKRYQLCGSTRGGFPSCEVGRRGSYGRGSRRVRQTGDDSQSLFAGYFRSLLDSDDSSELLDISQSNGRKVSGYEAAGHRWSPAMSKWGADGASSTADGPMQTHCPSGGPPYNYASQTQTSPTPSTYPKSNPAPLSQSPSSAHSAGYGHYSPAYAASSCVGPPRSSDCSFSYSGGGKTGVNNRGQAGYSGYQAEARKGYGGSPSSGPTSPGGAYMTVAKGSPFSSSSSPECYKQYNSNQWSFRQGYSGWPADNFGPHAYNEYGANESKDILDISNYTPQKAKRPPFPESLSESSSDSSHPGSGAAGSGPPSMGGVFKQSETVSAEGPQSSLSSLEKLMIDWHESASAPSYNWSHNVLFQGGGTSKPGRGRRKRTEQPEKEAGSVLHSDSPSSPSPTLTPKRGGAGGRGRGSRGGRGGVSGCSRERLTGSKGRGKSAAASSGLEASGLFQEGLDYYSGDSSSLSPNSAPPSSYLPDPCEYPSPYSAHPSTPSSEERYPALYPGESSSSLSPGVSSPPYPAKPQSYHLAPSRNFSPSCSPLPRVTAHCSSAMSPSYRPPPKDVPFSQYDSPSYCASPYWYGQTSHSSTPSPSTHPHTSPHASTHGSLLASPPNAHMNPPSHEPPHHPSAHAKAYAGNAHAHANNHPHHSTQAAAHSAPSLYDECGAAAAAAAAHKQELMARQALLTPPPLYAKSALDEDSGAYSLSQLSCQAMGHRYPSQQGGGVLCQLLDQGHDDGFSVTSL